MILSYLHKNFFTAWPLEYIIYTAAFPSAMTGADLAIFAGCFAYIADVSSVNDRTLRVGILDVVYLSTMPAGVALGKLKPVMCESFWAPRGFHGLSIIGIGLIECRRKLISYPIFQAMCCITECSTNPSQPCF